MEPSIESKLKRLHLNCKCSLTEYKFKDENSKNTVII